MSTYEFVTDTSRIAPRPGVAARALTVALNLYRAWKNRRAFYRLGEMNDAELADIGLTRADLHVAFAGPLGSDPTVRLRTLAEERVLSLEDLARRAG